MRTIGRVALLGVYVVVASVAAGVVSGGGHGSFAPLAVAASWPLLGLRYGVVMLNHMEAGANGGHALFGIGLFVLLMLFPTYYGVILRVTTQGVPLGRAIGAYALHAVGGLTCAYAWDIRDRAIPSASVLFGVVVGIALLAGYVALDRRVFRPREQADPQHENAHI